jgi:exopolysaccharide biosynthesis polyprenyl glycosylphosphotransferase
LQPCVCDALTTDISSPTSTDRPSSRRQRTWRPPAALRVQPRWLAEAPEAPGIRERDRLFRRGLVIADALAAALALLIGVTIIGDDALRPIAALFIPLAVLVSKAVGLYDRDELLVRKTTLDDVPALLQLSTAYALMFWLLSPELVDGIISRRQAVGLWALLLLASLCGRTAARELARRLAPPERCLLVGDARTGDRVAEQLDRAPGLSAEVIGRVELDQATDLAHSLLRIERLVRDRNVHRVIVAPRAVDSDGVLDAIRLSKGLGVRVSLLPRVFEVVGSSIEFDDVGGMLMLGLRRFGLTRSSWMLKRTMDWIGAAVLLVLAAPLIVAIAVAIRLDTRGPILFRQTRVGKDGRRFEMLKFRTMVDGADRLKPALLDRNEADGLFKIADDPRVTRLGRFLRRSSLDELPQLFNVLSGDMSLVGPRPLVVDEDDKVEGWHRRRLHLKPGMTGQWQILGSARVPLHEMVKIDYLYVANWSLWGDVKILLRTIPYLVSRGGM